MVPAAAVIPSLRVYFDVAAVIALLVENDEEGRDFVPSFSSGRSADFRAHWLFDISSFAGGFGLPQSEFLLGGFGTSIGTVNCEKIRVFKADRLIALVAESWSLYIKAWNYRIGHVFILGIF
jgi:hypothetical protein